MQARLTNVDFLLAAIQSLDIERNKKEYEIRCVMSAQGMKLIGHTKALDVSCVCWLDPTIFEEYRFISSASYPNSSGCDATMASPDPQTEEGVPTTTTSRSHQQYGSQYGRQGSAGGSSQAHGTHDWFPPSSDSHHQENDNRFRHRSHQFVLSRSVLHDALKNQMTRVIELAYDPMKQELSIIGRSSEERRESILRLAVITPEDDFREDLLSDVSHSTDDHIVMLPEALKTVLKRLQDWSDVESRVFVDLFPKHEPVHKDILRIGIAGKSVECAYRFPYHSGLFQKFNVQRVQRHLYPLRSLVSVSKAIAIAASARLQFSQSGFLLITIPVCTSTSRAFTLNFYLSSSLKLEMDPVENSDYKVPDHLGNHNHNRNKDDRSWMNGNNQFHDAGASPHLNQPRPPSVVPRQQPNSKGVTKEKKKTTGRKPRSSPTKQSSPTSRRRQRSPTRRDPATRTDTPAIDQDSNRHWDIDF